MHRPLIGALCLGVALLALGSSPDRVVAQAPLDVDGNGMVDAYTDGVYVVRRLSGLPPVPPGFRAGHAIPADEAIAAAIDGLGAQLDVDGDGDVEALSDGAYLVRTLLGLPPVPPSLRRTDPDIAPDAAIAARVAALDANPPPTPTPTTTPPPSATPTASAVASSTTSPSPSPSPVPSPSRTATPSGTPTATAVLTPAGVFRSVAGSAQGVTRLGLGVVEWLRLMDEAVRAAENGGTSCTGGGSAVQSPCAATADGGERTITYQACVAPVAGGGTVERNGRVRVQVANPGYCSTGQIQRGDVVRVGLEEYRQVERDGGAPPRLDLQATLTVERTGRGAAGCAGPTVDEAWTGTLTLDCQPGARSLACGPRPRAIALTAEELGQVKRSQLAPSCTRVVTVSGSLHGDDMATGEDVGVRFAPFELRTRTLAGGVAQEVSVGGTLAADCLGAVALSGTVQLAEPGGCPIGGAISPGRGSESGGAPALAGRAGGVAAVPPPGALRQQLFRAANGRVYQVIQNTGSDASNGAEAVRLTTLVASAGAQVRFCGATSGNDGPPAAAVGVGVGNAVPLGQVRGSAPLGYADAPSFDQNAGDGDGRLCVGPDCSADARCGSGQSCVEIRAADLLPLETAAPPRPAAQLTQAPAASCADVAGLATYAFGSAVPTTSRAVCQSVPSDGVSLATGQSLVLAYDVPALEQLNAGVAGLPVDLDGSDLLCSAAPNQVLSPGRATIDTAAAPQVSFGPDGAALDYDPPADGPGRVDEVLACVNGALDGELLRCDSEPPVRQPLPCAALPLAGANTVTVGGALAADGADHVPPPPCVWAAQEITRDQVYQYTAPAGGTYVVRVTTEAFLPVLHARAGDCQGPLLGEAACQADGTQNARDGVAELTLELEAGQTVALIVDARRKRDGAFTLDVRRKLPDLVVRSLTAPAAAQAGDLLAVAAEIANEGDQDAGPFAVEFLVARDASLADVVSAAPLVCNAAGLAAGAVTTCAPANRLAAPLVAAGSYVLGVRVDPDGAIDEVSETNNDATQALSLAPAPGVSLRQEVLRAADGTTYQIVSAVPTVSRSDAGSFQLTSQAMSAVGVGSPGNPVDTCAAVDGAGVRAAVGAAAPIAPALMRRSAVLHPSSFPPASFDVSGHGRLRLGRDGQEAEICADGTCGDTPLVPLGMAGGDVPAACAASRAGGFCGDGTAPATLGFGIAASAGICSDAARPTAQLGLCAVAPSDGLRLRPGEQVVFVSDTDRGSVSAGVAGFALASDAQNARGCVANRVIDPVELHQNTGELPLFRLVQKEIVSNPSDVAVSPDGRHVYIADAGGVLTAYERVPGQQALRRIDVEREGELSATGARINGLENSLRVVVSPDGAHVYVISAFAIGIFQRDVEGGSLAYSGAAGVGFAIDGIISPDGQALYVITGQNQLLAFRRDVASGALQKVDSVQTPVVTGVAVSPDSADVYVGAYAGAQVLRRDPETGTLMPVQTLLDQLVHPAPSGDGAVVFGLSDDGIAIFRRDQSTGALSFAFSIPVDPSIRSGVSELTASATGGDVYLASAASGSVRGWRTSFPPGALPSVEPIATLTPIAATRLRLARDGATMVAILDPFTAVAVLARDTDTGGLSRLGSIDVTYSDTDLPSGNAFAVAPDGATVYSNDGGLRADRRSFVDGHLDPIGRVAGTPPLAIAVSPDSLHVYTAGADAVSVYRRDAASGAPQLVEVQQGGPGGLAGLTGANAVVVSHDGHHVYATAGTDGAVTAFSRDPVSGTLQPLQVLQTSAEIPLANAHSLALSPDDEQLYVAAQSALVILARDAVTGLLSPGPAAKELPAGGSLAATADGRNVYVAVPSANDLVAYARDAVTGALDPFDSQVGSLIGLEGSLVASPDGAMLFLPGYGVRVLFRDPETGALPGATTLPTAFEEFFGALAVSPDNRNIYLSGRVFARALSP